MREFDCRATWSQEDGEYVATCAEFPSLSWLAATEQEAIAGITMLCEDAADIPDHERTMRMVEAGVMPMLTDAELDVYLNEPNEH